MKMIIILRTYTYNLHNDKHFLPGKLDIKKYQKLICNLYEK